MDTPQTPKSDTLSLGNLLTRITSPTPDFWKGVQTKLIKYGLFAGAIIAANKSGQIVVPGYLINALQYVIVAAGACTAMAQFTVAQAATTNNAPANTTSDDSQATN
ncbi:MAG: hypothetical protein ACXVJE_19485 [Mucilaginibacter sp.]